MHSRPIFPLENSLAHLQLSQSGTLSLYREAALRKIWPHCTMPPMMLPRNMTTMHSSTKSCECSSRAQLRSKCGWLALSAYRSALLQCGYRHLSLHNHSILVYQARASNVNAGLCICLIHSDVRRCCTRPRSAALCCMHEQQELPQQGWARRTLYQQPPTAVDSVL